MLGPQATARFTGALTIGAPPPSSSVAVSLAVCPSAAAVLFGASARLAALEPLEPIARHWIDSFCAGVQEPTSIPPVSSTWVLSTSVVATPLTVTLTVGTTVSGVHDLG